MARIGFIGLGVMGEPMCRNLAVRGGHHVVAFDMQRAPLERLSAHGVIAGSDLTAVVAGAEFVFLMLPGGKQLSDVCRGPGGLLELCQSGQTVVDCSTSPVDLTRQLAEEFGRKGVD